MGRCVPVRTRLALGTDLYQLPIERLVLNILHCAPTGRTHRYFLFWNTFSTFYFRLNDLIMKGKSTHPRFSHTIVGIGVTEIRYDELTQLGLRIHNSLTSHYIANRSKYLIVRRNLSSHIAFGSCRAYLVFFQKELIENLFIVFFLVS